MRSKYLLAFVVAFGVSGVVVWLYGMRKPPVWVPPHIEPYVYKTVVPFPYEDAEKTKLYSDVGKLIASRNYKGLDDLAATLASERSRFSGGDWRILFFDNFVLNPANDTPKEADWEDRIAFLHAWIKASPRSIYGRTALVNAEFAYGYFFRGSGYAKDLAEGAREKFEEHIGKARSAMNEARQLPAKYVGYHRAVLDLARLDGTDRKTFEAEYADAIAFEPKCQPFFKLKAMYLLPQWHGQFGESETFAEKVKSELGGDEGVKMYAYIIGQMSLVNQDDYTTTHRIMWDDVVKGFELREAEFGPSRYNVSLLARMSFYKNDHVTTCEAFRRLDSPDAYEPDVWYNAGHFNASRAIALNQLCPQLNNPVFNRFPGHDK